MTRRIAHRANRFGPNPKGENNPVDIVSCIAAGLDVEIDIWLVKNEFFLGHDKPQHKIDIDFIEDIREESWFHCKNLEALHFFTENMPDLKFFWHQEDDFALTSNGYIWTYPGKPIGNRSIIVVKEKDFDPRYMSAYGICSDYWLEI